MREKVLAKCDNIKTKAGTIINIVLTIIFIIIAMFLFLFLLQKQTSLSFRLSSSS